MTERDYLIALAQAYGLGCARISELRRAFGGYEAAWWARESELRGVLGPKTAATLIEVRRALKPEKLATNLDRLGLSTITLLDPNYPALLREIHSPPPVLYLRGTLPAAPTLSVVGTRRITPYGREATHRLITPVASSGIVIISGLAFGIDAAAHEATLKSGGVTVAVLAGPAGEIAPPAHQHLAERILERGAILWEQPPDTTAQKGLFAARNRIIAGLSRATLVIEAPQKSGALITASQALAENRDVLAVPGPITSLSSEGTNSLLKLGATPITSPTDILEVFGQEPETPKAEAAPPANPTARRIWGALETPHHIDELVTLTGLDASELGSALTLLELEGRVRHLGKGTYTR